MRDFRNLKVWRKAHAPRLRKMGCQQRERIELKARGVEVTRPIDAQGWGILTTLRIPGGGELGPYEPRHPTAF